MKKKLLLIFFLLSVLEATLRLTYGSLRASGTEELSPYPVLPERVDASRMGFSEIIEVDDIESLFDDLGGMRPPPPPQPASATKVFFRRIGLAVLMRGLACKRWCVDSVQAVINYIKKS